MTFRLAESKYSLYFGLSLFLKEVSPILYQNPWQFVPVSETKQSELCPRHKQSNMQYILDSYKKIEKRINDGFETRIEIENIQLFWNNLLASLPAARLLTYMLLPWNSGRLQQTKRHYTPTRYMYNSGSSSRLKCRNQGWKCEYIWEVSWPPTPRDIPERSYGSFPWKV